MSIIDLSRYYANVEGTVIGNAFASRRAVMPWRDKRPVAKQDIPATWLGLMSARESHRERLAYIHIPFCANHCLFCGFYRNGYTPAKASAYVDLLISEIEREADEANVSQPPIQALYLGGGTPSALSTEDLSRILGTVKRHLPLAPNCEITVEGRIIHFDDEKIDACIEAGINRISIGVQSFDTMVRRGQGRRSDKEEVIRFLERLRDRDQVTLVIDLLFGLPGQTEDLWKEDLRIAVDLAPDGVDLYGLNLIPGTPLHKAAAAGKLQPTALQALGAMYVMGTEFLRRNSWRQISNSHWSNTPRERNIYNLRIKEGVDCLAYGSGAGGHLGHHTYNVAGDLQRYTDGIVDGYKPLDGISVSDHLQPMRNRVIAGFEVGRLDLDDLHAPHIPDPAELLLPLLEQWQAAGLLVLERLALHLTTAGRFWYSNLITAFNDILSGAMPPDAEP